MVIHVHDISEDEDTVIDVPADTTVDEVLVLLDTDCEDGKEDDDTEPFPVC